jgi:DNA topoisomerase-1
MLADAVKLFEYPKNLGKHERKNVKLCKGQYGFYLKYGDDNVGLKISEEQAEKYTINDAIERIEENNKKILWEKKDKTHNYAILEGPYGKFISMVPLKKTGKTKYIKLPKNIDLVTLTLEKILDVIKNSYSNKIKKDKKEDKKKDKKEELKPKEKKTSKSKEQKEINPSKIKKMSKKETDEIDDIFNIKKPRVIKK